MNRRDAGAARIRQATLVSTRGSIDAVIRLSAAVPASGTHRYAVGAASELFGASLRLGVTVADGTLSTNGVLVHGRRRDRFDVAAFRPVDDTIVLVSAREPFEALGTRFHGWAEAHDDGSLSATGRIPLVMVDVR